MSAASFEPGAERRATQCLQVLALLREGPKTSADFHAIKVLSPAARVMDLRRAGHDIITRRIGLQGQYVLLSEAPGGQS